MRYRLAILALALATGFAQNAAAQSYPNKPITVIVPFAAGGPTDVVARIVGEHMSRTLGQQLIVENVGGAGGTTGMARAAQAAPDGYTIAVGNMGTQSAAPSLYPEPQVRSGNQLCAGQHRQLHAAGDRRQAGHRGQGPQVLHRLPAGQPSEAELRPRRRRLDQPCVGHGVQFAVRPKPGLVAYRGTGPALNDLVGGQIDYMVDQSLNVIPQIKAGTIKAYAIAAPERLESLPDVPTTKEAGIDFIFSAWNAMVAPKDTPKEVVDKLVDALGKALDDPTVKARFVELGSTAPTGADRGPAGLQKLVESEVARITPVLKAAQAAERRRRAKN